MIDNDRMKGGSGGAIGFEDPGGNQLSKWPDLKLTHYYVQEVSPNECEHLPRVHEEMMDRRGLAEMMGRNGLAGGNEAGNDGYQGFCGGMMDRCVDRDATKHRRSSSNGDGFKVL